MASGTPSFIGDLRGARGALRRYDDGRNFPIPAYWEEETRRFGGTAQQRQTSDQPTPVFSKGLATIAEKSLLGQGDVDRLYPRDAAALYVAEGEPLKGCQHAVLGFGSSMYDTFMNCPRLCDKYLGDCGSRRMVQRAELDEVDEKDDKAAPSISTILSAGTVQSQHGGFVAAGSLISTLSMSDDHRLYSGRSIWSHSSPAPPPSS